MTSNSIYMTTVRELFRANPVIPFIIGSFYLGG
jgi:hypothetical protein